MIKLFSEKIARVAKNREKLEKELDVKISNRGKEVYIEGDADKEYIAEKALIALDFGFPFSIALLVKKDEEIFKIINIKDHTKRKDLHRIKSRIIGTNGKTLKTLSGLTGCNMEIKDNSIGLIGPAESILNAETAIISIIHGSKQGNVYNYLEKHRPEPILDLGLKTNNKL